MAKQRNNSEVAKRNRANRSRGSAFEKKVGDYLDMDVVPYSGSNARFGYGDVRDSIWLVECKNIKIDDGKCTIKEEWFTKNRERALVGNRLSVIAWMPTGKANKYIILEEPEFIAVASKIDIKTEPVVYNLPKKVHNTVNMILDLNEGYFTMLKSVDVTKIRLTGSNSIRYLMTIETFKNVIAMANMKGTRSLEV